MNPIILSLNWIDFLGLERSVKVILRELKLALNIFRTELDFAYFKFALLIIFILFFG